MNVEWSPRASRDLDAQIQFIAKDKPSAAVRMLELTKQTVSTLGSWPNMGKLTGVPGALEFVIPKTPFVAIYKIGLETITIVRLMHGAQLRK